MVRAFCELCLVFGAASSAGIYDRVAKVVLFTVIRRCGFQRSLTSQHLDDCCAAAPAGDDSIYQFDNEYKAVAGELGIQLAPRDNPEKSFGPTTEGCVYGINYNTVTQMWWMGEEKIARLMTLIRELVENVEIEAHKVWSLADKIGHVNDLAIGGRFYL